MNYNSVYYLNNEGIFKFFNKNYFPGEEPDETDFSINDFDFNIARNIDEQYYPKSNIILDKIVSVFDNNSQNLEPIKRKIFGIIYREKNSVFTNIKNEEIDSSTNDETFLKRKRGISKKRRFENQDNIRKKIKRGFLNYALITNINNILNIYKIPLYLEKFPQKLVVDIAKKTNKNLLSMRLEQIFEKKELYDGKNLNNYNHNLKVIKSKEVQENRELKAILGKKYCELFEEYINSGEFKNEINRLKKYKMDDNYIERYIYLAKHLNKFFSE